MFQAPQSLAELQERCSIYRSSRCPRRQAQSFDVFGRRHLCKELCYFRAYEASRQLRAMQDTASYYEVGPPCEDRAKAAGVPWSPLTARCGSSECHQIVAS